MKEPTLKDLIKEAEKNFKTAQKAFLKWDNVDDMHAAEAWSVCLAWLKAKVK